ELAYEAVGDLSGDRHPMIALELFDHGARLWIQKAGWLDLSVAEIGERPLYCHHLLRRCDELCDWIRWWARRCSDVCRLWIVRNNRTQQTIIGFRIDLQSGGRDKVPRRGIGLGAPDAIGRAVIEAFAREFALDIADELKSGLIGRGQGLNSLRTRCGRRIALKQWSRCKNRRRMRPLLHEEGIGNDRENREGRHDEAHESGGSGGHLGREPSGAVKCGFFLGGRSSSLFSSPKFLRSLLSPHPAGEQFL